MLDKGVYGGDLAFNDLAAEDIRQEDMGKVRKWLRLADVLMAAAEKEPSAEEPVEKP